MSGIERQHWSLKYGDLFLFLILYWELDTIPLLKTALELRRLCMLIYYSLLLFIRFLQFFKEVIIIFVI